MDLELYLDLQNRVLVSGPQNTQPFVFPPLYKGDTLNLILNGVTPNNAVNSFQPYNPTPIQFNTIKCGIGPGADFAPENGTFTAGLVGNPEVTAPLAFNISQADFLAAINALPSVLAVDPGGLILDEESPQAVNFFYIRWVNPTITALFQIVSNTLEPLCFVRSYTYALPKGQLQMLKFIVAPYTFTDQFSYPNPEPVSTESIRVGTGTQNCIQSITIPADSVGGFTLAFSNLSTTSITVSDCQTATDASATIAAALNGVYSDGLIRFAVTQQEAGYYYVEFVGVLALTDYPVLVVTMNSQVPLDNPEGALPLNTVTLELAMHGQEDIDLIFAIQIDNGNDVSTPIQVAVTVINNLLDSAMALADPPDWLVPVGPAYPPYNPGPGGPTIMAPGAYVSPVGTGVGTGTSGADFVITHNLNTLNVLVGVRQTGAPYLRVPDDQYTCAIVNENQVEVTFQTAPTAGEYEIIIAAVIPAALALPYFTITIAQVIGLQAILTALLAGTNPADLWPNIPDSKLPTHIGWNNPDGSPRFGTLPDSLLPADVVTFPIPGSDLPPGTPYYVPGPPPQIVVTLPGPPPQTIPILVGDPTTTPPTWTLPVDILPDPSTWPGLIAAIIAALQAGAPIPAGYVPMLINPVTASIPAPVVVRAGQPATPGSLPTALEGCVNGGNISGVLPLPSAAIAGKYYTVTDGASCDAVRWRAKQVFFDQTIIGCDGQQWFPVRLERGNAYPVEMEVDLFTLQVTNAMFPNSSRFACGFEVYLSLTGACANTTRGMYLMRIQLGTVDGPDIHDIAWSTVLEVPLILGSASVGHSFGYTVARSLTGVLTANAVSYGYNTVVAQVLTTFVLKASLVCFDMEVETGNTTGAAPVGQVNIKVANPVASVAVIPNPTAATASSTQPAFTFLPNISTAAGGGALTDLSSYNDAGVPTYSVVMFDMPAVSMWRLENSTDPANGATGVCPTLTAGAARVWRRRL